MQPLQQFVKTTSVYNREAQGQTDGAREELKDQTQSFPPLIGAQQ